MDPPSPPKENTPNAKTSDQPYPWFEIDSDFELVHSISEFGRNQTSGGVGASDADGGGGGGVTCEQGLKQLPGHAQESRGGHVEVTYQRTRPRDLALVCVFECVCVYVSE